MAHREGTAVGEDRLSVALQLGRAGAVGSTLGQSPEELLARKSALVLGQAAGAKQIVRELRDGGRSWGPTAGAEPGQGRPGRGRGARPATAKKRSARPGRRHGP